MNRSPNCHLPQIKPYLKDVLNRSSARFSKVYPVQHATFTMLQFTKFTTLMRKWKNNEGRESLETSCCPECSKILFTTAPYHKMQEAASHDYAKLQHFAHRL